jgi:hypothetical protein
MFLLGNNNSRRLKIEDIKSKIGKLIKANCPKGQGAK